MAVEAFSSQLSVVSSKGKWVTAKLRDPWNREPVIRH